MQRRRQIIEPEPLNSIELVRLAIARLRSINSDFEVERDPMSLRAHVLAVHIAIPKEFILEHVRAVLLGYLLVESVLDRVAELETAAARISGAVLVSGSRAPFAQ